MSSADDERASASMTSGSIASVSGPPSADPITTTFSSAPRVASSSRIEPSGFDAGAPVVAGAPTRNDTFILVNVLVAEK